VAKNEACSRHYPEYRPSCGRCIYLNAEVVAEWPEDMRRARPGGELKTVSEWLFDANAYGCVHPRRLVPAGDDSNSLVVAPCSWCGTKTTDNSMSEQTWQEQGGAAVPVPADRKAVEAAMITPAALQGGFKADGDKARLDLFPIDVLTGLIDYVNKNSPAHPLLTECAMHFLAYWENNESWLNERYGEPGKLGALWAAITTAIQYREVVEEVPSLTTILEVGEVYAIGARKYAARNWEKGMDFGRLFSAGMRHLLKLMYLGEKTDPVDGQHHISSVIWCAVALHHFETKRDVYAAFDTRNVIEVATDKGQK
jgi:hypothetical protein